MKSIIQLFILIILLVLLLASVSCTNKVVPVKKEEVKEEDGKGRKPRYRQSPGPWMDDYAPIKGHNPHIRN